LEEWDFGEGELEKAVEMRICRLITIEGCEG
jgi:hypothetical protein